MRLMQIQVVLATDLLARGIDLPDVKYVINFDMPLTEAEFKHRIGRTGRFGTSGTSLSLLSANQLHKPSYITSLISSGLLTEIPSISDLPHFISSHHSINDKDNIQIGKRRDKEASIIEH